MWLFANPLIEMGCGLLLLALAMGVYFAARRPASGPTLDSAPATAEPPREVRPPVSTLERAPDPAQPPMAEVRAPLHPRRPRVESLAGDLGSSLATEAAIAPPAPLSSPSVTPDPVAPSPVLVHPPAPEPVAADPVLPITSEPVAAVHAAEAVLAAPRPAVETPAAAPEPAIAAPAIVVSPPPPAPDAEGACEPALAELAAAAHPEAAESEGPAPLPEAQSFDEAYAHWLALSQSGGSDVTPKQLDALISRQAAVKPYPLLSPQAARVAAAIELLDQYSASAFARADARAAAEGLVATLRPSVALIWPEPGAAFDPDLHTAAGTSAGATVAGVLRPGLDARAAGGGVCPARVQRSGV